MSCTLTPLLRDWLLPVLNDGGLPIIYAKKFGYLQNNGSSGLPSGTFLLQTLHGLETFALTGRVLSTVD